LGEHDDLSGRTLGEFVVRERMGEGGFGAVYRCEQPLLGREAVIKVLHRRLRQNDVVLQRFLREARLASRLDHPYAAHVYAFGIERDDGLFWIAMERVLGTTLTQWLHDRGPLPLDQLVPFFERVAEVVQTAHDGGIVHRDLKPSNVMVIERAGQLLPKLLDFGIAKLLDEAPPLPPALPGPSATVDPAPPDDVAPLSDRSRPQDIVTQTGSTVPPPARGPQQRLTQDDVTLGSPPYMSPEQWSHAESVGPGADLYALGVVAYEALTGRRPFSAKTAAEYIELHHHADVPPLGAGFPPVLDRVFQRALAKRPEDRWGSALELAAALRAASGLDRGAADLPGLDPEVRDAWLAEAPQPLAESIAAFDGARNAHEARDTAQELVRSLVRYLLAVALATHAQVRVDGGEPAVLELVRTMRHRELADHERVRLLRLLVRPLTSRRGAHPIPELVDLATPRDGEDADSLDPVLAIASTGDRAGTEEIVRSHLARLVPAVTQLLRKAAFILDYVLVVARDHAAERWTGLRRPRRALATLHLGELVDGHAMLLDRAGRICVDLWPLLQAASPTQGAAPELFLFDGRGRHGARLIAAPAGFEHHDPGVWDWVAARVIGEAEPAPDAGLDGHPPYLGLTSFSTSDADRFVGREREVDGFLNRLRQRPLQIVVGPSGAGKSSFVHAGVVPGLPQGWRTVTLRPGSAPLAALASRLAAAQLTATDLRPLLASAPAAAAALVAHAAADGTIVIVIDQLEELFTLCADPAERAQLAAVVAELAASAEAPIRVICTIRDDFLMQLEALEALRAMLSPALVLLGNPSREALVRIVVEPARRAGYALSDPALAPDMVAAVADRPGALALLSFTASRLWELRDRRFLQLTRSAYDAMGGVGGALGRHAEATLDALSPAEQRAAREVFRHLVTAGGTRAVLTSTELHERLATPRAQAVIDKLVAARLITVSEGDHEAHVEVIHEALIDAWPRLQQWVREDVDGARMREQLRTAARQWHDRGRPRALVWRDDVLADLERWLRPGARALSELEAVFVEASRRDARRAVRIRRGLALVAFGAALAFAGFQYRATRQTRVAQQLAEARATQSYVEQGRTALLDGKHLEALIYLGEAVHRGDASPSVRFMLARAAQPFQAEVARLPSTSGRMWSARFSPDGRWIVTTDDRSARVWDARTMQLLHTLPHASVVYNASFSVDGARLVTASADGFVKVWDLPAGTLVRALTRPRQDGRTAEYGVPAMSPDGRLVAAIDVAGKLADIWDVRTGAWLAELSGAGEPSEPSLEFSRDGAWLAICSGEVRVFETRTWTRVFTVAGADVSSASFDPAGPRLATATLTGDASIWTIPSGERIRRLRESGDRIAHIAFSPDGTLVVAASADGAVRVWRASTGALHAKVNAHRRAARWAELDPTSQLVVSSGGDNAIAISDLTTGLAVSVLEGPLGMGSTHFDPSARRVIAASWDGTARVWDAAPAYRRWSSPPVDQDCGLDTKLDDDQRFLAVSCVAHGSHVWDTAHDQLVADLPSVTPLPTDFGSAFPAVERAGERAAIARGIAVEVYALPGGRLMRTIVHPAAVSTVAFAGADHAVVSGSVDGTLLITPDAGPSVTLPGFPGGIDAVGFLPDGRVVAASMDGRLRVYDPGRRLVLAELALPRGSRARSFRVAADGHRLISIPTNGSPAPPVLWDLEHYRVIAALEGHKGQVFSARFVRGDREILTSGSDGAPRLWDGLTGRLEQTYFGSSQFLLDAMLDPGGSIVVGAGGDGVLRFWDAAAGRLIWTLPAHRSAIVGIHFEGTDLVTRGFQGEVSRWALPALPSAAVIERVLRCLPLRFDEKVGALVEQVPCSPP
jgi:WD40 repeat protein/serine/threonine protein kinase